MASFSRAEMKKVFNCFDEDGDGKISAEELKNKMRSIGEELSIEDVNDAVGGVPLSLEEFIEMVSVNGDHQDIDDEKELREAFSLFEMEGQGCITVKSLKRMLSKLGTSRDLDECCAMISRFDLDGDGVLSFEEFKVMML
ncbi:Calmodulin and related proteins (EF-Hand superfamily) protein [Dioscorea alata]|uniref:Calmodulin and related proteins (EF-Hand superfamily) protein n=1 Tax=Dioscorea alata TaxID=55571 RepID=A0ACB7V369_DIOAL|nr:Calmodulin and related proteins (EF-Hand superfamily) protein [Dioscorea alata]